MAKHALITYNRVPLRKSPSYSGIFPVFYEDQKFTTVLT